MTFPSSRRAHVVGLGLIGGSVALALGEHGWTVTGTDFSQSVVEAALTRSVISGTDMDDTVELVVIATPANAVVAAAEAILSHATSADLIVTDVSGVKGVIGRAVQDPRFIGGHPMAGSEQRGLDGARADLFRGCTWVLTPTNRTAPASYSHLHGLLRELDANVMALDFDTHDRLVAMASHLPHLVAGALMNEASVMAEADGALLQLAAGGFRDMTRVSAGDPGIWPDILLQNASAVVASLRGLQSRLKWLEDQIASQNRETILDDLVSASRARRELPGRGVNPEDLTHLRVPVPDRPGVLAQVTTTASDLNVNIYDIEIAHSVEGQPGVILLAVVTEHAELLANALNEHGYLVAREESA
jgi:prephenate dehydrogenase